MTALFGDLERASALFTSGDYIAAIPVLTRILAADPNNLDATLRLATAHSSLGHDALAVGLQLHMGSNYSLYRSNKTC